MQRPKKDGRYLNLYLDKTLHEEFEQFCENLGQTKTIATERALRMLSLIHIQHFVLRKSELAQLKQDIPDILDAYTKESEQDEEDDLDIKSSVEDKPKKEEPKQEAPKDEVTVTVKKKKKKKEKAKEKQKKPHQKREKRFGNTYNPNEYISQENSIRVEEIEQTAKERAKDPDARARAITYDKITGTSKMNKTIQEICKNGEEILSQLNSAPFDLSLIHI